MPVLPPSRRPDPGSGRSCGSGQVCRSCRRYQGGTRTHAPALHRGGRL